ncbi:hypothetical protein CC80DRAFT_194529 [Byssothecium circinans]|uniref:Uncharacterized protein n=1 Tax=Byssothecium circinans TaxID=147558 RepID=A0A6A5UA58_9PLEO|nr:hypothetical protein CC80DRAFT_194529 [Byssothecium circinans]
MHLQADAGLAEAPGISTEQLQSLSRSIEAKKQKLEADIDAYIKRKQRELAHYEQELLAQQRQMECDRDQTRATSPAPSAQSVELPTEPAHTDEKDKGKRTKQTRVHKREKELFGLTTIFLPLLEASESAPPKKENNKKRQGEGIDERGMHLLPNAEEGSPSHAADHQGKERRSRCKKSEKVEHADISYGDAAKDKRRADSVKKTKRPAMKKSSLRNSGEKTRRKRVSLVIDDQIVLPADHIPEPPPTSPSDAAASSASSSTTSLEDAIDPRLMPQTEEAPRHEHQDALHHSLPLSLPTKQSARPLPEPVLSQSPVPQSPLKYKPPLMATTGRTVIDPSPPDASAARHIPQHASSAPIYASAPERNLAPEEDFSSYVGGIEGSGVDDVDQTGSLGFPSSLGASFMESYMQSRPLSVRMAAAEKAELDEEEAARARSRGRQVNEDIKKDVRMTQQAVDDDMDVIGNMEEV